MSERDIRALLALVEKTLGRSWLDISDWLRDQNSIDAIESRLLAGDYAGIVREVESAARTFAAATHDGYIKGGRASSQWLDKQPALKDKLVRFDVTNDRAVYQARQNEIELVRGLTRETRETVQSIIIDGTRESLNPRVIARDIKASIGLTPSQDKAVRNYRRALENGDWSNALSRELSSGQGDRTIRRIQRDGGSLTEKQIESLTERYRQNALKWRAETIARTETLANVHAGLDAGYQQAIERGDIEAGQLVKEWIHASRGKSRPDHVAMNGKTVRFDELFEMPDGSRMKHPGDPAGGAKNRANCRCTVSVTIASL